MNEHDKHVSQIRGLWCRATFDWAFEEQGPQLAGRILERAREEVAELQIDPRRRGCGFRDSDWYRAAPVLTVLEAMMENYPEDIRLEMAEHAGRFIFDRQVHGTRRALFAVMLKPRRFARYAQKAWDYYFNDGIITVEGGEGDAGRDWHRSVYSQWGSHSPLICRMMMAGKLVIYESMGCKDVKLSFESCDPSGEGCASLASWNSKNTAPPDSVA